MLKMVLLHDCGEHRKGSDSGDEVVLPMLAARPLLAPDRPLSSSSGPRNG